MFKRSLKQKIIDRFFKDDEYYSSKFIKLKNMKNSLYKEIRIARFVTKRNASISAKCIFKDDFKLCHGLSGIFITEFIFKGKVMIQQNVTIGKTGTIQTVGCSKGLLYIGAGAFIDSSITMGENVIIGANAIVTKDVPPNTTVISNNVHLPRPNNNVKILKIFER